MTWHQQSGSKYHGDKLQIDLKPLPIGGGAQTTSSRNGSVVELLFKVILPFKQHLRWLL